MSTPTIIVAGAAGDLGARITKALIARGATVRALCRPEASAAEKFRLEGLGASLIEADPADLSALAAVLKGGDCVVSALNGLRNVIVDRQSVLLDAAVKAGVPRFIPSDYSIDFTKTQPGLNRNLDLRRDFMSIVDRADIAATSILNGAFMDMLGEEVPIIQPSIHRVVYWRSADQLTDWTTKDDVAAYTAAAAMDAKAPRILRVVGDAVSVRQIAQSLTEISGKRYKPMSAGGLGLLGVMIGVARLFASSNAIFPAWQGMQYTRDMFSGAAKLHPLDNGRYPDIGFTSVKSYLTRKGGW